MALYKQHAIGKQAEDMASAYLQNKGFILLEQNYRCLSGEVDLIMRDQEHIVFVEVRYRQRTDYGNALESINTQKTKKIIKAAHHFLQMKRWLYKVISRFDIIVIHPINGKLQLQWVKNAFSGE